MDWPPRALEGFALAAAARGDRGARAALPGLRDAIAVHAASIAEQLARSDVATRRGFVRRMLDAAPAIAAQQPGVPPRALALLAASVDKNVGRGWLAGSALPRPGFAPDPRLIALLRALAARARPQDAP